MGNYCCCEKRKVLEPKSIQIVELEPPIIHNISKLAQKSNIDTDWVHIKPE